MSKKVNLFGVDFTVGEIDINRVSVNSGNDGVIVKTVREFDFKIETIDIDRAFDCAKQEE